MLTLENICKIKSNAKLSILYNYIIKLNKILHNIVKITIMSNNLSKNLCYTIALLHI